MVSKLQQDFISDETQRVMDEFPALSRRDAYRVSEIRWESSPLNTYSSDNVRQTNQPESERLYREFWNVEYQKFREDNPGVMY
jgi:hypothetical protein